MDEYRELLWLASQKWGLDHIHEDAIPLSEILTSPDGLGKIELFTFNGKHGFCVSVSGIHSDGTTVGFGYGPFLKFCEPFQSRDDALDAAVRYIMPRLDEKRDREFVKWLRALQCAMLQPRLFE